MTEANRLASRGANIQKTDYSEIQTSQSNRPELLGFLKHSRSTHQLPSQNRIGTMSTVPNLMACLQLLPITDLLLAHFADEHRQPLPRPHRSEK